MKCRRQNNSGDVAMCKHSPIKSDVAAYLTLVLWASPSRTVKKAMFVEFSNEGLQIICISKRYGK